MEEIVEIKKENDPDETGVLLEEEIKVEEPSIQSSGDDDTSYPSNDNSTSFLQSVIVEKKLPVCFMCKNTFERSNCVKLRSESDYFKCNKCILHSRLSVVFKSNPLNLQCGQCPFNTKWKRSLKKHLKSHCSSKGRTKQEKFEEIPLENIRNQSVIVKKLMYICQMCKTPFERMQRVKVHEVSDWSKCNKCILHSRLSSVFHKTASGIKKSV